MKKAQFERRGLNNCISFIAAELATLEHSDDEVEAFSMRVNEIRLAKVNAAKPTFIPREKYDMKESTDFSISIDKSESVDNMSVEERKRRLFEQLEV